MIILLRPFEILVHRLWLYCLGPLSFVLADYGYDLRSFQFLARQYFQIIWLSTLSTFNVHDKGYSWSALCELILISTFSFLYFGIHGIYLSARYITFQGKQSCLKSFTNIFLVAYNDTICMHNVYHTSLLSFIQEYNNTSLFDQTGALKGQRQYNKWFDDIYSNKDEQFNDKDQSKPSFCFKIVFKVTPDF